MGFIADTPKTDYYAVIFTVVGNGVDQEHDEWSKIILEKASTVPGYLGYESAGTVAEVTVSYWKSLDAIKQWKQDTDHKYAQTKGKQEWFKEYRVRVCKVERDYSFVSENK
ncbi:hypothetical protein HDV04_003911 [Boothiomyces sp. JEL0838]|nr:hypothetical protein HDV04_003911 [Boothiomyces sp. JEL0838]